MASEVFQLMEPDASNDQAPMAWTMFTNDSGASSTKATVAAQRDPFMARVELAILAAMLTVSVLGNALALVALKLRHRKLSRMHFFFVHLCVADLVVAVFHILSQLLLDASGGFPGGFVGDRTLCKAVMYLQMLGPYSSSYVLSATAIDRYQAICFPLSNCSWTPRRSQAMVGVAWLLALIFDLPQLFVFDYFYGEYGRYDCYASFAHPWGERIYVLWVTVAIFVVPLCIIVYTYTCICRAIWVNFRQKSSEPAGWRHQQSKAGVNVLVGGANRFKGKCKVEVTVCQVDARPAAAAPGLAPASGTGARGSGVHPRTHSMSGISRAKIKTFKLTVVVIVCYVACYSPFYSSMLYVTWYPQARHFAFYSSPAFTILALLASLNSCVNPWLYLAFNENLTMTLKELFCCRGCRSGGDPHAANEHVNAFSRSSLSETKSCVVQQHRVHYHRPAAASRAAAAEDNVRTRASSNQELDVDDRARLTSMHDDPVDRPDGDAAQLSTVQPLTSSSDKTASCKTSSECSSLSTLQTASSALNLNCCHFSTTASPASASCTRRRMSSVNAAEDDQELRVEVEDAVHGPSSP